MGDDHTDPLPADGEITIPLFQHITHDATVALPSHPIPRPFMVPCCSVAAGMGEASILAMTSFYVAQARCAVEDDMIL